MFGEALKMGPVCTVVSRENVTFRPQSGTASTEGALNIMFLVAKHFLGRFCTDSAFLKS